MIIIASLTILISLFSFILATTPPPESSSLMSSSSNELCNGDGDNCDSPQEVPGEQAYEKDPLMKFVAENDIDDILEMLTNLPEENKDVHIYSDDEAKCEYPRAEDSEVEALKQNQEAGNIINVNEEKPIEDPQNSEISMESGGNLGGGAPDTGLVEEGLTPHQEAVLGILNDQAKLNQAKHGRGRLCNIQ
jgi:hypothetical protein